MKRHWSAAAVLLWLTVLPASPLDAQRSMPDSLTQLNRTGNWNAAFDLASEVLKAGPSGTQECQVQLSLGYSALRLFRISTTAAALDWVKRQCAEVAGIGTQVAQLERDMAELPALDAVVLYPLHREQFVCGEHYGVIMGLGDRFGSDCTITRAESKPGGRMPQAFHRGDGLSNEDWYGWGMAVLAPFDAVVEAVTHNPTTNEVGTLGSGRPTSVTFVRADSVRVVYGHLGSVTVSPGDVVRAGEPVGTVGNNGQSYAPHTHIGAWRGAQALQVRFDLRVPIGRP